MNALKQLSWKTVTVLVALAIAGCDGGSGISPSCQDPSCELDGSVLIDAGLDGGIVDSDAGAVDDAGLPDSGEADDAGVDAGQLDSGSDIDGGSIDSDGGTDFDGGADVDAGIPIDGGMDTDGGPIEVSLVSIEVTPIESWLLLGDSTQLTATGHYSDGSSADVSAQIVWSSSNESIASVSNGLVSATQQGAAVITASLGDVFATATVYAGSLDNATIAIVPSDPVVAAGTNLSLTVWLRFADGSERDVTSLVSWSSLDESVATVSAEGVVHGVRQGLTTIVASNGAVSASVQVFVAPPLLESIQVEPANVTLPKGTQTTLRATGTYSDGSTQDVTTIGTWSVDQSSVASITSSGTVFGANIGTASATITIGDISASVAVQVLPPDIVSIEVTAPTTRMAAGRSLQLTATATLTDGSLSTVTADAVWSPSDALIATVSSGIVHSLASGNVVVTAAIGEHSGSISLVVEPAELDSITVVADTTAAPVGRTIQLSAVGLYSDGTTLDLTSEVAWISDREDLATIDGAGLVTARAEGVVTASALFGGQTASIQLTVTPPVLDSIAISPSAPTVPKGTAVQLTATGVYSDGSTRPLIGAISWSSTNPLVASVNSSAQVQGVALGVVTIQASNGGVSGTVQVTVGAPVLVSITVSPAFQALAQGRTASLTAFGTYSDGSGGEITADVTWSSSAEGLASVSSGVVQTLSMGTARITAALGDVSGVATVVVTPPELVSLAVTPDPASRPLGLTQQFAVTGTYTNATTGDLTVAVTWSSANANVATISSLGLATTKGQGTTLVTATLGTLHASATLNVLPPLLTSIAVTPVQQTVTLGLTGTVSAIGTYSDGSTDDITAAVSWSSSQTGIVTIAGAGTVRTFSEGAATITAQLDGITGTAQVTVGPATLVSVAVTPADSRLPKGTHAQLTATGTYTDGLSHELSSVVSWASAQDSIVVVDASGDLFGARQGTTSVTATLDGISGSANVTVDPPVLASLSISPPDGSFALGRHLQLSVEGTLTDGTTVDVSTQADWSVSDPLIATISSDGLASGIVVGIVQVTATVGELSATTSLTVSAPELVSLTITPRNGSVAKGLTLQMTATGLYTDGSVASLTSSVDWGSSNQSVASMSTQGIVQANAQGQTAITASVGNISTSTLVTVSAPILTTLTVTPANASLAKGRTASMTATGTFSDGVTTDLTSSVTWRSGTGVVAFVSSDGVVEGLKEGQSTIFATFGAVTGSTTLFVTAAELLSLVVTPVAPSVALGLPLQLTATATYTDGARDVSALAQWTAGNVTVATVDGGAVTAISEGFSQMTATLDGLSDSTLVHVLRAQVVSISLTPSTADIAMGETLQLTATATYTDGHTGALPTGAVWTSTNTSVATVAAGLITSKAQGNTTIRVTADGISASSTIRVLAPQLRTLTVTPPTQSVALGRTVQLSAVGAYSDGTFITLTGNAAWSTSASTVATVSTGLVQSQGVGVATISATIGGVTGTAQITVTDPVIVSIAVTPASANIPLGTRQQMTAIGTFSDGTSRDLTTTALWTSSATTIATVSSVGLVQSVKVGSSTITANWSGVSGATVLTVGPKALVSLVISPSTTVLQPSDTVTLTAQATYTDETSADVSSSATWTSSNTSVASLSGHVVQGNSGGTATISAVVSGMTATATVNVASLVSIAVTPGSASVRTGSTQQFFATGTYSNGGTRDITAFVTWSSDDTSVATIASTGLAQSRSRGSTTVSATSGGISGSASITVIGPTSISISPASPRLPVGAQKQFTATATFADGTTSDVTNALTWSSNNTAVGTVSSTGLLTTLQAGLVTLTATDGTVSATDSVFVMTLSSITVTPAAKTIARGTTQQMTATGTYSDGITQDVTSMSVWSSTFPSVATVSATGLATGVGNGATTLKATIGSVFGSTTLNVSNPTLVRVVVSPIGQANAPQDCTTTSGTVRPLDDMQLRATGILSDGTTQDLSLSASWSSSNSSVATVSSSGYFHSVTTGTVTISATYQGVTGTMSVSAQ